MSQTLSKLAENPRPGAAWAQPEVGWPQNSTEITARRTATKELEPRISRMARIKDLSTQSRNVAKTPRRKKRFAILRCYIGKLGIFGKIFPPLLSLFAPVQILWLRLDELRLCVFAPLR
jgi:hypothetical protein